MRAPPPASTTEDRINRLLVLIDREGDPEGALFIRGFIDASHTLKPLATKVRIEAYTEKLLPKLLELEALLAVQPEGFTEWAFRPGNSAAIKQRHGFAGLHAAAKQSSAEFREELARLRQRTELIGKLQIGRHGSSGVLQHRAAISAAALMFRYTLPITVNRENDTAFSQAASIFFEEFTEQPSKEIRRACKWMENFYSKLSPQMRSWCFEFTKQQPIHSGQIKIHSGQSLLEDQFIDSEDGT